MLRTFRSVADITGEETGDEMVESKRLRAGRLKGRLFLVHSLANRLLESVCFLVCLHTLTRTREKCMIYVVKGHARGHNTPRITHLLHKVDHELRHIHDGDGPVQSHGAKKAVGMEDYVVSPTRFASIHD